MTSTNAQMIDSRPPTKEISELRQEMKTMKDKAHEQERLQRKEHFEYLDIQSENVSLLYELAMLRENMSAKTSLGTCLSPQADTISIPCRCHQFHLRTTPRRPAVFRPTVCSLCNNQRRPRWTMAQLCLLPQKGHLIRRTRTQRKRCGRSRPRSLQHLLFEPPLEWIHKTHRHQKRPNSSSLGRGVPRARSFLIPGGYTSGISLKR
ncbi:hypothetical protein ARMGADRAFT_1009454 [Armillaria gallica]|uniref:Uncharacterized protein n=1 Tax=Armillaria gallica TaxID=47427 RepID=A0A2H3E2S4_ARMGA|nr:hypothetical protein ARMGADRAFT_1009454 [Armillaria gallica]